MSTKEMHWLESMQRTMAYIMAHTEWTSYPVKEGISEQGMCLLPGFGHITIYRRADTGEEIFTEESMGVLLQYTNYHLVHGDPDDA